jgi:hypothetical protein
VKFLLRELASFTDSLRTLHGLDRQIRPEAEFELGRSILRNFLGDHPKAGRRLLQVGILKDIEMKAL